jgi:hypothetical protein
MRNYTDKFMNYCTNGKPIFPWTIHDNHPFPHPCYIYNTPRHIILPEECKNYFETGESKNLKAILVYLLKTNTGSSEKEGAYKTTRSSPHLHILAFHCLLSIDKREWRREERLVIRRLWVRSVKTSKYKEECQLGVAVPAWTIGNGWKYSQEDAQILLIIIFPCDRWL